MGFKWKDSLRGGINGFRAGSRFGPTGMAIGATAGAVGGGFAKNINKKLTGNSQSGTVEGLIESAGNFGSPTGGAENLFSRSSKETSGSSPIDLKGMVSGFMGGGEKENDETKIAALLKMIMAQENQAQPNFQPNAYMSPRLEMAGNQGY